MLSRHCAHEMWDALKVEIVAKNTTSDSMS